MNFTSGELARELGRNISRNGANCSGSLCTQKDFNSEVWATEKDIISAGVFSSQLGVLSTGGGSQQRLGPFEVFKINLVILVEQDAARGEVANV